MTLQELITDLKAAGANENTIRLAMNCYELGRVNEREACDNLCQDIDGGDNMFARAIRARGQQ